MKEIFSSWSWIGEKGHLEKRHSTEHMYQMIKCVVCIRITWRLLKGKEGKPKNRGIHGNVFIKI